MIHLTIAKSAREWREEVFERARFYCEGDTIGSSRCPQEPTEAHHVVFRSHLSPRALWIVENGIALCKKHHDECHASHNAILPKARLRVAVDAVNCVEQIPVKHFTKGRK